MHKQKNREKKSLMNMKTETIEQNKLNQSDAKKKFWQ